MRDNHFYFQPELMFSQSITNLGNQLGGGNYEYGEYDFNFNSIELPLLLGYRASFGNVAVGAFLFDLKYDRVFSKVGEEIARISPVVSGEESSFLIA